MKHDTNNPASAQESHGQTGASAREPHSAAVNLSGDTSGHTSGHTSSSGLAPARRAELHSKLDVTGHGGHGEHVNHEDPPEKIQSLRQAFDGAPPHVRRWATGLLVGAIVLVTCIAVYRHIQVADEAAAREADIAAGPRVNTAKVIQSPGQRTVNLVGEAKPFASVTLYAKVSGYLRDVKVDKGDHVKKNQVLAVIDAPETNMSIEGLHADSKNKQMIAKRMVELRAKNLASAQEAEQAESDAAVAKSRYDSLSVQQGEQFLRAPFDGTVTARFADAGALVQNAMNSQTSSLPVVSVAQTEHLRVYVYVDQRDASFIVPGRPVTIHLTERPDVEIKATVTRISGELDGQTRMLLTEIDVDNKDGAVVAGSFVQVALNLATPTFLEIPAAAMVPGKNSPTVPVISEDNHLHFQEIKIADMDGKNVQVVSGLKEGDTVALNVGSNIAEGSKVRPQVPEADAVKPVPAKVNAAANGATVATGAAPTSGGSQSATSDVGTPPQGAASAGADKAVGK